jgi:ribosomal protein S18 acetylase RimI-like enzyme
MLHGKLGRVILYQIVTHLERQALDSESDDLRGVVVCKLENHRSGTFRGYIAMLAVVQEFRGRGIATKLVEMAIESMKSRGADEVLHQFAFKIYFTMTDS